MSAPVLEGSDEPVTLEHGMRVCRPFREARAVFGDQVSKTGRMYAKDGQLVALGKCFRAGLGIRAAAKSVGCCKDTSAKLYRILQQNGADFRCRCGQELAHHGSCQIRRPLTPAPTDRIAHRREIVRRASAKWYAKKRELAHA